MPHCILEYTDNILDNIDNQTILKEIHETLAVTGLFNIDHIKSRALIHKQFYIGDGGNNTGFAALSLAIFNGRDSNTRKMLSERCLEVLKPHFVKSLSGLKFDITVQITEINRESYTKYSIPDH
jgi:5-carboxymethyl-2-hydroxymuconate isomerase